MAKYIDPQVAELLERRIMGYKDRETSFVRENSKMIHDLICPITSDTKFYGSMSLIIQRLLECKISITDLLLYVVEDLAIKSLNHRDRNSGLKEILHDLFDKIGYSDNNDY